MRTAPLFFYLNLIYNYPMDAKLKNFQKLHEIFKNNGFSLYLVGGTVRDYLLKTPLTDMDAVTDATPKEMEAFIPDANFRFAEYGSVTYKFESIPCRRAEAFSRTSGAPTVKTETVPMRKEKDSNV